MAEGVCAAQLSASIEAGPVVAGCERGENGGAATFGELDVATVSAMDRPSLRNGEVSQRLQRFFAPRIDAGILLMIVPSHGRKQPSERGSGSGELWPHNAYAFD